MSYSTLYNPVPEMSQNYRLIVLGNTNMWSFKFPELAEDPALAVSSISVCCSKQLRYTYLCSKCSEFTKGEKPLKFRALH